MRNMLQRKLLSCFLTFVLVLSMLGAPAAATTIEDSPQTATSVTEQTANDTVDQGLIGGLDAQVSGEDGNQQGEEQSDVGRPDDGAAAYSTQPTGDVQPLDEQAASSSSEQYVPGPPPGQKVTPEVTEASKTGVVIDVDENIDVVIDNQAVSKSGTGTASGTQINNNVGGISSAVALDDSGQPIAPSESGALADNSVVKAVGNTGTASAESGLAGASNTMDANQVTVAPDATTTVAAEGEIINSNVLVKVLYNYWAGITGLAQAITGDTNADGLIADNTLYSNDKAVAKGDDATVNGGGDYNGSALAANESDNLIVNTGNGVALSGEATATNTMIGNDIVIAPIIDTFIKFCSDIIDSDVTIEVIYNFMALISGKATAQSGNANATGAAVDNEILNKTSAKAVGDAPLNSGSSDYSDGSALSVNDTANTITNAGGAVGVSGNAAASNTMENNDIVMAPIISSGISILDAIINSNILIRVTYNIWATIAGSANATTGDVDATGVAAENSIENTATATALGDSARATLGGGSGLADGEAVAVNDTANSIANTGDAVSMSGDATAKNTMLDNLVNLSPVIDTVVMVCTPIIENGMVIIDVVYDIWATLTGTANAVSGNATSAGVVAVNGIDSNSEATAIAQVTLRQPDGSATAVNSSDNNIENDGIGVASTGNAGAKSNMAKAEVSLTGYLEEDFIIDTPADTYLSAAAGADLAEIADATTGNATAVGSTAESGVRSTAISKDIFGMDGYSFNKSDDDVYNTGTAIATTSDAQAVSGKLPPNHTENKVVIGFGGFEDNSAAEAAVAEPVIAADTGLSAQASRPESAPLATEPAQEGSAQDTTATFAAQDSTGGGDAGQGALADEPQYASAEEAISAKQRETADSPSATDIIADPEASGVSSAYKSSGAKRTALRDAQAPSSYAKVVKSYIDTLLLGDAHRGDERPAHIPWWALILVASVLAGWVALMIRVKPWRKF